MTPKWLEHLRLNPNPIRKKDKGRFTLAYISLDYLDNVLTRLPGWKRVKWHVWQKPDRIPY